MTKSPTTQEMYKQRCELCAVYHNASSTALAYTLVLLDRDEVLHQQLEKLPHSFILPTLCKIWCPGWAKSRSLSWTFAYMWTRQITNTTHNTKFHSQICTRDTNRNWTEEFTTRGMIVPGVRLVTFCDLPPHEQSLRTRTRRLDGRSHNRRNASI